MVRALLIALLGMIIGPAIVTICLFTAVHSFIAGEPLDGGGWASVGIFGGLAAVIVLIGWRAWRADRKRGPGFSAERLVPYFMIVGLGAGLVLGWMWSRTRLEGLAEIDRIECGSVFRNSEPPAGCERIARECRRSDLDLKEVDFPGGMPPRGVWPDEMHMPPLLESRARMLCIYRRTR